MLTLGLVLLAGCCGFAMAWLRMRHSYTLGYRLGVWDEKRKQAPTVIVPPKSNDAPETRWESVGKHAMTEPLPRLDLED